MEYFKNILELKQLMDKLILETLEMIEEDVTLKISIEKLTNEGALLMAKTRYAQGTNSVSTSQLPAESDEGREFNALKTIYRTKANLETVLYELKQHSVDKEFNRVEPINWFGILVPHSLRSARDRYEKAIELSVESANVQQRLQKNYQLLDKLKTIKVSFGNHEE